jgi:nucleotide-binding universal stress UspA family protein
MLAFSGGFINPEGASMYKRILLAYNGSEAGQKALLDCRDVAQWGQASLSLVAVMPLPTSLLGMESGVYSGDLVEQEKETYQATLNEGLQRLSDAGYQARGEVLVGETVDEICEYARKMEADLIVVGHKHLDSWAARWWRGSISGSLIEHAPCNVLVVITA